jgi:hypothetical protein
MRGAIPPLPQYAFMAWCLVKAQGQLYILKEVYCYENRPMFLRACHWDRSWDSWVQYTPSHPIFVKSSLILSSHGSLGFIRRLLLRVLLPKFVCISHFSNVYCMFQTFRASCVSYPHNIRPRRWRASSCDFLHRPIVSFCLGPGILLGTPSLCSSVRGSSSFPST